MPFSKFDQSTQQLLAETLALAWSSFPDADTWDVERKTEVMERLTVQLVAAAERGERNVARLMDAALAGERTLGDNTR